MPDGDTMVVITKIVSMIAWYESVADRLATLELKFDDCPEEVMDDPEEFDFWIEQKREQQKQKMNYGAKR